MDWTKTSRYCPPSTSVRIASHGVAARAAASASRPAPRSMSSAQTRARSPSRMAAAAPNRAGRPRHAASACRRAKATCTVGRPRRVAEASMRSSCTSAHAWISSNADTARSTASTAGPSGSPPAPRQPHHAKVGRMRLPPPSTNSHRSPAAAPNAGSMAAAAARRRSRKAVRVSSSRTGRSRSAACTPTSAGRAAVGLIGVIRVVRAGGARLGVGRTRHRAYRRLPSTARRRDRVTSGRSLSWAGEGDRQARPGPARVLGRVLPAQGRGGRGRAVAGDPAAGAAGPGVRVRHLRRRRVQPGPHDPHHRPDRDRDHARRRWRT